MKTLRGSFALNCSIFFLKVGFQSVTDFVTYVTYLSVCAGKQ